MTGQSRRLHRQAQPSPLATTSARAPAQPSRSTLGRSSILILSTTDKSPASNVSTVQRFHCTNPIAHSQLFSVVWHKKVWQFRSTFVIYYTVNICITTFNVICCNTSSSTQISFFFCSPNHQLCPGSGYFQGFMPPPTYQAAMDGSDGGITAAGGEGEGMDGYEWPIIDPPSGIGPKSSSTPLIREGMRLRRGQRQAAATQQQPQTQAAAAGPQAQGANLSGLFQELDTL